MGRVGLQDSGCDPRDSFKRVTVCVNDVHESTKARQLTHCEHRTRKPKWLQNGSAMIRRMQI